MTQPETYAYCEKKHRHVSLEQSEGQCRDRNGCTGHDPCPLEGELGQKRFSRTLEMLAASLGSGWMAGRG